MVATVLPVIAVESVIVFPHAETTLSLARARSIKALEAGGDRVLVVLPRGEGLHDVGTVATPMSVFKPPVGPTRVLLRGTKRARILSCRERAGFLEAVVDVLEDPPAHSGNPLDERLRAIADAYAERRQILYTGAVRKLSGIGDPVRLSYAAAGHVRMRAEERQALLEINDPWARLARVADAMQTELDLREIEAAILQRVT